MSFGTGASAQHEDVTIQYHEPVRNLIWAGERPVAAVTNRPVGSKELRFTAYGRDFRLDLESNDSIIESLPGRRRSAWFGTELYRGALTDVPGSWARITRHGNAISGVIWDGAEYYGIDPHDNVSAVLAVPESSAGAEHVIYRLSDTTGQLSDLLVASGTVNTVASATGPLALYKPALAVAKRLEIGVVADAELGARFGNRTESAVLNIMNTVDGIFINQIGIHLHITELIILDGSSDPFESNDPDSLLDQLADYKDATSSYQSLGLMHLMTGRDLDDLGLDTDPIVGIANIGVLCEQRSGVALSQTTFGIGTDSLIVAHELGHNFGAPHDAEEGSVCANVPEGMLMTPYLDGSKEFSQCSVDQMLAEINAASCLLDLEPVNMTLQVITPPALQVNENEATEARFRIENNSLSAATDVELAVDAPGFSASLRNSIGPNAEVCVQSDGMQCNWPTLLAGGYFEGTFRLYAANASAGRVDVSVTSLTESDRTDDSVSFDIDVVPLIDLAVIGDTPGIMMHPGESGTVSARVSNKSTAIATDVRVILSLMYNVELLDSGLGPCTWNGDTYRYIYDCPIGDLSPGEVRAFDVGVRSLVFDDPSDYKVGPWLGIQVTSSEPEEFPQDNAAWSRVTIGENIGDIAVAVFAVNVVDVNDQLAFSINVSNNGPDPVTGVTVEGYAPGHLPPSTIESISTPQGSCSQIDDHQFDCDIGELAVGETVQITLSAVALEAGELRITATGATLDADADPDNNAGSKGVNVREPPAAPPPAAPSPSPAPAPSSPPASGDGGGGGGSLGWPSLLSLFLLSLVVRRRRDVKPRPGYS